MTDLWRNVFEPKNSFFTSINDLNNSSSLDDFCTSSFNQLFIFSASVVTTCCQSQVGSPVAAVMTLKTPDRARLCAWLTAVRFHSSDVRVCRRRAGFCLFLFTCLLAVCPSEFDVCERSFNSTVSDINRLLGWNFSLQVGLLDSCQNWFAAHTLPVYFTPHGHTLSLCTTERKNKSAEGTWLCSPLFLSKNMWLCRLFWRWNRARSVSF